MSEDGEKPEVLRVKVRKGADEDERKTAIGQEVFNQLVSKLVSEAESHGITIDDPDNLTTREVQNYSEMLRKLKDKEDQEIRSMRSESPSWQDNEEGINRNRKYRDEGKTYDSTESMIRDLRQQSRDKSNPTKAAEADAILNELWKKYAEKLKENIKDPSKRSLPLANYEEDKETAKMNKIKKLQREGA